MFFFFCSSRRRHTRLVSDWSSDVCSSDLEDVVETARALRLNIRYAPSMRNGTLQSDRGNAILSTLPVSDAHAIEFPLVLQRRVAVSTALWLGRDRARAVSAHLDPREPPGHPWIGSAGR